MCVCLRTSIARLTLRLAREVRQADLSASCRHMNFRSKWRAELATVRPTTLANSWLLRLERHEVEMTELYKQRRWLKSRVTMSFRLPSNEIGIDWKLAQQLESHCCNTLEVPGGSRHHRLCFGH